MKLRIWDAGSVLGESTQTQSLVRLGRDPRCEVAFDATRFPKVSSLHAQIKCDGMQAHLIPMSKSNQTLINDQPITAPQLLMPGDRIRLGYTGPIIEFVGLGSLPPGPTTARASTPAPAAHPAVQSGSNLKPIAQKAADSKASDHKISDHKVSDHKVLDQRAAHPTLPTRHNSGRTPQAQLSTTSSTHAQGDAETLMGGRVSDYVHPATLSQEFVVGRGGIIGRDVKLVTFLLDHPQVSRVHARLNVTGDRVTLTDLGSANGTFCNGLRVPAPHQLEPGDTIDIGPFALEFDGESLKSRSRSGNVQLCVSNVSYTLPGGNRATLLRDLELVINPGEFLCLLGPSGSGKSTLLNVMSGRRLPSEGKVLVNHRDLHANFSALKQDLAVVPQATVLHDTLTVQQSFQFTSELRLPSDLSAAELEQCVESAIATVGLHERKQVRIAQLSGGQLKRAGLGSELLSDPTLLFLDEVTSGLDEHSDGEMMRLFRGLADGGKTLVCITHNLAHVEENCHLVAILTKGGRLAFLGSPAEALAYFRIHRLSDIYTELQTREPEAWAGAYRSSPYYERYVARRLPARQSMPDEPHGAQEDRRRVAPLRQFQVLLRRTLSVWLGDLPALGALFGQALLVTVLLCLVFGKIEEADPLNPLLRISKIRNLALLVTVSCFWLGCNNSVKEIVKERLIYRRERDYNLVPESYLLSKWIFMGVLGIIQSWLLTWLTFTWCAMPADSVAMLANVTMLSLAGTSLGLAISANSKNEEMAVALVPIVVIPQIILAGVVASLPSLAESLARTLISAYWGQHAVNASLPEEDQFSYDFDPTYRFSLCMILLHTVVFWLIAWAGVRRHRRN